MIHCYNINDDKRVNNEGEKCQRTLPNQNYYLTQRKLNRITVNIHPVYVYRYENQKKLR